MAKIWAVIFGALMISCISCKRHMPPRELETSQPQKSEVKNYDYAEDETAIHLFVEDESAKFLIQRIDTQMLPSNGIDDDIKIYLHIQKKQTSESRLPLGFEVDPKGYLLVDIHEKNIEMLDIELSELNLSGGPKRTKSTLSSRRNVTKIQNTHNRKMNNNPAPEVVREFSPPSVPLGQLNGFGSKICLLLAICVTAEASGIITSNSTFNTPAEFKGKSADVVLRNIHNQGQIQNTQVRVKAITTAPIRSKIAITPRAEKKLLVASLKTMNTDNEIESRPFLDYGKIDHPRDISIEPQTRAMLILSTEQATLEGLNTIGLRKTMIQEDGVAVQLQAISINNGEVIVVAQRQDDILQELFPRNLAERKDIDWAKIPILGQGGQNTVYNLDGNAVRNISPRELERMEKLQRIDGVIKLKGFFQGSNEELVAIYETLAVKKDLGSLSSSEFRAVVSSITNTLSEIHALGMTHDDISPNNILFRGNKPILIDFGTLGRTPGYSELGDDLKALAASLIDMRLKGTYSQDMLTLYEEVMRESTDYAKKYQSDTFDGDFPGTFYDDISDGFPYLNRLSSNIRHKRDITEFRSPSATSASASLIMEMKLTYLKRLLPLSTEEFRLFWENSVKGLVVKRYQAKKGNLSAKMLLDHLTSYKKTDWDATIDSDQLLYLKNEAAMTMALNDLESQVPAQIGASIEDRARYVFYNRLTKKDSTIGLLVDLFYGKIKLRELSALLQ